MRPAVLAALLALAACARPAPLSPGVEARSPPDAPASPIVSYPVRGDGPPLPSADKVLSRIAVVCCPEPGVDLAALAAVAEAKPDLLVFLDDAATEAPARRAEAYGLLNLNAQFASLNMAVPMLAAPKAAWTEPDAERAFETYWAGAALGAGRNGVHGGRTFGLPGRRVQILVLGAEPGEAERTWLNAMLQEAVEVRLIVGGADLVLPPTSGALVRLSGIARIEGAGKLQPPPLSGPGAGFALVEIDWPGRRALLSRRGVDGRITETATTGF